MKHFVLQLSWALLMLAGAAQAHEVHEVVQQHARAIVVTLSYADGEPFAAEYYEVYADGSAKPTITGRTDAQGRIVFLPDDARQWRVRSFSADGHGVDVRVDAAAAPAASQVVKPSWFGSERLVRMLLGLGVLAAGFFALWRWTRRHKARNAHP